MKPVMSPRREEYYSHAHTEDVEGLPTMASTSADNHGLKGGNGVSKLAASTSSTTSTTTSNAPTDVGRRSQRVATTAEDAAGAEEEGVAGEGEGDGECEGSLDCDTDSTGEPGGNLLVETATEADADAAEERLTQSDMCSPGAPEARDRCSGGDGSITYNGNGTSACGGGCEDDSERAREAAAYKHSIRIRPIDIIRVPKYERVWEIGKMGQDSAAKCLDFERHEWASIRVTKDFAQQQQKATN